MEGEQRRRFCEDVFRAFFVHPVALDIGVLAGRIEGEQAARGIGVPFEDLVLAATALHLGFGVATANLKHFQLIHASGF
jgi:predicted nucleic acid-binding protein